MATRKQRICSLLEELLKSAESRDREGVLRINKALNPLIKKEQKNYNGIRGLEYDSCRQSCVLPFTLLADLPRLYARQIADARKRLSKIKSRY